MHGKKTLDKVRCLEVAYKKVDFKRNDCIRSLEFNKNIRF